jgi:putative hemolysin
MDGMIGIHEAERVLERKDMRGDEDFETLAGFVLHHLGHIPQTGEFFDLDGIRYEVVDMDGRRIDRVLVGKIGETAAPAEAGGTDAPVLAGADRERRRHERPRVRCV